MMGTSTVRAVWDFNNFLIKCMQVALFLEGKKENDGDKLAFALDALDAADPFSKDVPLPEDVLAALSWLSVLPADTVNYVREVIITGLEGWAADLRQKGECSEWFLGCDAAVVKVAEGVNGPMLRLLAALSGHVDPECIEFFRVGAPLYGLLDRSGIGVPIDCAAVPEAEATMREHCLASNAKLLAKLREDPFAKDLMELTRKDAALGRMSEPVPAELSQLGDVLLVPRFGIEQGLKEDGSVKVRAVDNFSWSPAPEESTAKRSKKTVKGVCKRASIFVHGTPSLPCVCRC